MENNSETSVFTGDLDFPINVSTPWRSDGFFVFHGRRPSVTDTSSRTFFLLSVDQRGVQVTGTRAETILFFVLDCGRGRDKGTWRDPILLFHWLHVNLGNRHMAWADFTLFHWLHVGLGNRLMTWADFTLFIWMHVSLGSRHLSESVYFILLAWVDFTLFHWLHIGLATGSWRWSILICFIDCT